MTAPLILFPRLHRELAFAAEFPALDAPALPSRALTLSPGLSASAVGADAYTPDYPWSPAESAACVADFERLAREGAHGSPVQAMVLGETSANGLSRVEQQALTDWKREMGDLSSAGSPVAVMSGASVSAASAVSDDALPGREAKTEAQRVLLLAWLREKQALELREIEERVGRNSRLLAGWLGEGVTSSENPSTADALPSPDDLPPWRAVLEATSVFLPPDAILAVTERGMADAVLSLAEPANFGVFSSKEDIPQGWIAFAVSVSRLLGRAPRADERPMTFLCPKAWAEPERS